MFHKQLQDWLVINISTNPLSNKRKGKGGDGEESPDKSGDGTLNPARSKKIILSSQSLIGNPRLNPESGQGLETTSEEDILSATSLGEESFIIIPVVVGTTSRVRTEVAKGPCKLLMIASIKGPKLLSRLILIW